MDSVCSNSYCGDPAVIFCSPHFFCIYELEIFCKKERLLISILKFVWLFTYNSVDTRIFTLLLGL